MSRRPVLILLLLVCYSCFISKSACQETDSDNDGLSDFHEVHKYFTDPKKADSDGDGKPDGDWLERREYQYTVRSVVQVLRPVTIEYLNDDYQDARILDQTETYVELEVIHYPFNKVSDAIKSDPKWRSTVRENLDQLEKWLLPGPTSNWTAEFKLQIAAELKQDGIDIEKLDDRQLAEQVSKWLLKRAKYEDGFSTFITAFDKDGKPYIPEELSDAPDRTKKITVEQQWEREISAVGMFNTKMRGSCSSSAIYLSGCLRAVNMPTRTILCIPIIDAGDPQEVAMVERLKHPAVRRDLLAALKPLKNSWASHTFNEVYIDGRWRRLNYNKLGQNIYDRGMFGLMTHVATFRDWADAKMPDTIGKRQKLKPKDVFGGANPYSTISLRDAIGIHCKIKLPEVKKQKWTVEKIYWTDSEKLPEDIRENCRRRDRFGLIARVTGFEATTDVPGFLADADLRVYLEPRSSSATEGAKEPIRLGIGFDPNCYWLSNEALMIYVPFGGGDKRDLVENVSYQFVPRNQSGNAKWSADSHLSITRNSK